MGDGGSERIEISDTLRLHLLTTRTHRGQHRIACVVEFYEPGRSRWTMARIASAGTEEDAVKRCCSPHADLVLFADVECDARAALAALRRARKIRTKARAS